MTLPMQQQKHVEAWHASGLSQAAYCREHKLNANKFSNWLRIYRMEQTATQVSTILPVTIKSAVSSMEALYLCAAGGHLLQLPANVSPEWLGELLKCLA